MRAVVVDGTSRPLSIREVPVPVPERGEVVVRLEAAGVCDADARGVREGWPRRCRRPFVPGHEGVGIVSGVGRDVVDVREGDRVVLPSVAGGCRACAHCVPNPAMRCHHYFDSPVGGTLADYAKAKASYLEEVPVGLDPLDVVPLACAGVVAHAAIDLLRTYHAELLVMLGLNSVARFAMQYAKLVGLTVAVVDDQEEQLQLAATLGADYLVHSGTDHPVEAIRRLGGADAAICGSDPRGLELAAACVAPGVVVAVTLPPGAPSLGGLIWQPPDDVAVVDRLVPTGLDLAQVFALHAAGLTRVVRQTHDLEEINEVLGELESGQTRGHVVFDLREEQGDEPDWVKAGGASALTSRAPRAEGTLLRPAQAAAYLGAAPKTLNRWEQRGALASVITPGGHRRFRSDEVAKFARERWERESPLG